VVGWLVVSPRDAYRLPAWQTGDLTCAWSRGGVGVVDSPAPLFYSVAARPVVVIRSTGDRRNNEPHSSWLRGLSLRELTYLLDFVALRLDEGNGSRGNRSAEMRSRLGVAFIRGDLKQAE
jgi:hypothetical protein